MKNPFLPDENKTALQEYEYLIFEILKNGDLKLSLTPEGQEFLTEKLENGYDVSIWYDLTEDSSVNGSYAVTDATEVGGLTEAPMIINYRDIDDEAKVVINDDNIIWWFPDYMVTDELNKLLTEGYIIFTVAQ
jgi:hypothetical protein